MRLVRYCCFAILLFSVVVYFISFRIVVSQQIQLAADAELEGYYFVHPPENSDQWERSELFWRVLYFPLIELDSYLSPSSPVPAGIPLFEL